MGKPANDDSIARELEALRLSLDRLAAGDRRDATRRTRLPVVRLVLCGAASYLTFRLLRNLMRATGRMLRLGGRVAGAAARAWARLFRRNPALALVVLVAVLLVVQQLAARP